MVLGIVVLVCFSPSIVALPVSIAGVSAAGTSTVAVGDISDGGTHGKEHDVNNKRRTSSKRHGLPPRRNIATSMRWVLLLGPMLVVAAHANDRGVNVDGNFVATDNQYPRSSESENADAVLIGNTTTAVDVDSFRKTTFVRDWLFGLFHCSASVDDPQMWWWGSTGAGRDIGIVAAIGAVGLNVGDTQAHVTMWPMVVLLSLAVIVQLPSVGKQRLQCLEVALVLTGLVIHSINKNREDGEDAGTVAWCEPLPVLVGLLDLAMAVVAIAAVHLSTVKECDARWPMELAEVTSFVNPTLGVKTMAEGEAAEDVGIEMTTTTTTTTNEKDRETCSSTNANVNERTSGKSRTSRSSTSERRRCTHSSSSTPTTPTTSSDNSDNSNAVTSFTNPRLNAAAVDSMPALSIDMDLPPTPSPLLALDAPLPVGWVAHKTEDGTSCYYEELATGETQWGMPVVSSSS